MDQANVIGIVSPALAGASGAVHAIHLSGMSPFICGDRGLAAEANSVRLVMAGFDTGSFCCADPAEKFL